MPNVRPFETTRDNASGRDIKHLLDNFGLAIVRGFFNQDDLSAVWRDLERLTSAFCRAAKVDVAACQRGHGDQNIARLLADRPDLQPEFYDRLQLMPSLLAIPNHLQVLGLAQQILESKNVGVWPRPQVRLDLFGDQDNVIEWHHDYIYNRGTSQ